MNTCGCLLFNFQDARVNRKRSRPLFFVVFVLSIGLLGDDKISLFPSPALPCNAMRSTHNMRPTSNQNFQNMMKCKCVKFPSGYPNSFVSTCLILSIFVLMIRFPVLLPLPAFWSEQKQLHSESHSSARDLQLSIRQDRFLQVPQIVWGLNNQKIAFARAALTARLLNRTLLMPALSASLFYKEVELLEPVAFDKIFKFDKFNSLCSGFIRLGRFSEVSNRTTPFVLQKGSGRRWTVERDLNQLRQCKEGTIDSHEIIQIIGKNPFIWHDHWPVKEYAKIFECLMFVDEIADEATNVITKIKEVGLDARNKNTGIVSDSARSSDMPVPYIAVHMRIEKDWMIHCKNLEQRANIFQICSSKDEIMKRVSNIPNIKHPVVLYLAVADSLLEDSSILEGWDEGVVPYEKKRLGVWDVYKKYPYLIQSAIDFEVCSKADVFVGNSFSTFSSLVVLERTQKLINMGITQSCDKNSELASYAYNVPGESTSPMRWMTNMSDSTLQAISYGTNQISCSS